MTDNANVFDLIDAAAGWLQDAHGVVVDTGFHRASAKEEIAKCLAKADGLLAQAMAMRSGQPSPADLPPLPADSKCDVVDQLAGHRHILMPTVGLCGKCNRKIGYGWFVPPATGAASATPRSAGSNPTPSALLAADLRLIAATVDEARHDHAKAADIPPTMVESIRRAADELERLGAIENSAARRLAQVIKANTHCDDDSARYAAIAALGEVP